MKFGPGGMPIPESKMFPRLVTRVAVRVPVAEGVKVTGIWQAFGSEQGNPVTEKSDAFGPVMPEE